MASPASSLRRRYCIIIGVGASARAISQGSGKGLGGRLESCLTGPAGSSKRPLVERLPVCRTNVDVLRLLEPIVGDPAIVENRAIAAADHDLPSLRIQSLPNRGILLGLREANEVGLLA